MVGESNREVQTLPFFYYGSWDYLWLILIAAVLGMVAQGAVQVLPCVAFCHVFIACGL